MAIDQLSLKTPVSSSTYFAGEVGGQDYRFSIDDIASYVNELATSTSGSTQYSAPSSTGFSVTIASTTDWLLITPTGTMAAGTIVFPSTPSDRDEIVINTTQEITTLTTTSAKTKNGFPTTLTANSYFKVKFDAVLDAWYRIG